MDLELDAFAAALSSHLAGPAGDGVAAVYVQGSSVGDRSHRESDVDVGVLLRHARLATARERFEAGLRLHAELQPLLGGVPLDLVVLNDAPPVLAAAVAAGGRRVYGADADLEHAFCRDSQLRAADLLPFLRRTAAIKREAIGR